MLKKRVVAAVVSTLMAGAAFAVGVNPGGKGESLVAPMVMVAGGWESEIRLTNTDPNNSVVLKLVFHERALSREVLDFFVFLSPGDVWRGTAKSMGSNRLGIESSDDSALYVPTGTNSCPAAVATSVGFNPSNVISVSGQDANFTYLTVLQARTFNAATTVSVNGVTTPLGAAPVDKAKILRAYSDACNANTPFTALSTNDAVTGDVTMRSASNGNVLSLPMVALDTVNNIQYHKIGQYTAFNGLATDPVTGVSIGKGPIEDALWANDFVIPFNLTAGNQTYATVTFPTKEEFHSGIPSSSYFSNPAITGIANVTAKAPTVSLVARNEKEETISNTGCYISPCAADPVNQLPAELNVLALSTATGLGNAGVVNTSGYERGWVNMNIQSFASTSRASANYNNFSQSGVPALVTVINWENRNGGLQGTWSYAAKTQMPAAR